MRLESESHSTQAARALNINAELLYKWPMEALTRVAAAWGTELDPATPAELRQLRAANRRQAQELEILKTYYHFLTNTAPTSRCRFIEAQRASYPVRQFCQVLSVPVSGYYT